MVNIAGMIGGTLPVRPARSIVETLVDAEFTAHARPRPARSRGGSLNSAITARGPYRRRDERSSATRCRKKLGGFARLPLYLIVFADIALERHRESRAPVALGDFGRLRRQTGSPVTAFTISPATSYGGNYRACRRSARYSIRVGTQMSDMPPSRACIGIAEARWANVGQRGDPPSRAGSVESIFQHQCHPIIRSSRRHRLQPDRRRRMSRRRACRVECELFACLAVATVAPAMGGLLSAAAPGVGGSCTAKAARGEFADGQRPVPTWRLPPACVSSSAAKSPLSTPGAVGIL